MPCACDQCLQHSKTLGLAPSAFSKELIHKAYREAAKQWHPDLFESAPELLPEAEARFKLVQVAYRELSEHQERPLLEVAIEDWPAAGASDADWPSGGIPDSSPDLGPDDIPADPFAAKAFSDKAEAPQLSFGNRAGCYTAPRLPVQVEKIIAAQLAPGQHALAIIDLARTGAPGAEFTQFLLLASHGVLVRDALGVTSLIWYSDLGEIKMIDQRRKGTLGVWQRMLETVSGTQQKYALLIYRRNGSLFFRVAGQTDDSVKRVLYNFLLRKKYQPQG